MYRPFIRRTAAIGRRYPDKPGNGRGVAVRDGEGELLSQCVSACVTRLADGLGHDIREILPRRAVPGSGAVTENDRIARSAIIAESAAGQRDGDAADHVGPTPPGQEHSCAKHRAGVPEETARMSVRRAAAYC